MSFVIRTKGIGNIAPLLPVQGTRGNLTTQSVVCLESGLVPEAELPPKVGRASTDGQGTPVSVIDSVYIDSDGNLVVVYNE